MTKFLRDPVSIRGAAGTIVLATAVVVAVSGALMTVLDRSEPECLPGVWALQTVTTVGYGDVTPQAPLRLHRGGRRDVEGIALLAIVTAAITSSFVERTAGLRRPGRNRGATRARAPDARFDELAARLDQVETLLRTLTKPADCAVPAASGQTPRSFTTWRGSARAGRRTAGDEVADEVVALRPATRAYQKASAIQMIKKMIDPSQFMSSETGNPAQLRPAWRTACECGRPSATGIARRLHPGDRSGPDIPSGPCWRPGIIAGILQRYAVPARHPARNDEAAAT